MRGEAILERLRLTSGWSREAVLAGLLLAAGFGLMPMLIYFAGAAALGRYEGASASRLFESVFQGLPQGSVASWVVVLGPYGLYLVWRALRSWWRLGTGSSPEGSGR